jgi:hypothetical protein
VAGGLTFWDTILRSGKFQPGIDHPGKEPPDTEHAQGVRRDPERKIITIAQGGWGWFTNKAEKRVEKLSFQR